MNDVRFKQLYVRSFTAVLLASSLFSCGDSNDENVDVLFEKIESDVTGIDFVNTVPENDTLNQFTYHYLYNGSGVAIGDINNDGKNDLYFSGNEKSSRLYLNKGDFKFEDITEKSGTGTKQWISGVTMVDVNNDGWLDIYVCSSGPKQLKQSKRNLLFINQKDGKFKESAKEWGVDDGGNATCATFFDYDNDGDLDFYLGNHADQFFSNINTRFTPTLNMDEFNQQHFFRNDGNKFTDVSEKAGVVKMGYCLSAAAADYNNDGLTDLYVCNDYHVPDCYYINNGDGTFTDQFDVAFKHSSTNSMGSDVADVNNDGFSDLITVDMLSESPRRYMSLMGPKDYDYTMVGIKNGYKNQYMKNNLQMNLGNGHFADLSYLYGVAKSDWSWSPLLSDFNDDGFTDMFVSNGYYRDVTNLDFILYQSIVEQQQKRGLTHEELLKKLPYEKIQNFFFQNNQGQGFVNRASEVGLDDLTLSTGSATGDLDGDGRLDLVVCNQGEVPLVYKNIHTQNHFLNVKAEGSDRTNKFGIGCQLFVSDSSGKYRKFEIQPSRGYQSSSEAIAHIGLGENESLSELVVVWPNGKAQILKDVSCDQTLVVKSADANTTWDRNLVRTGDIPFFTENESEWGLNFNHVEQENPDFKREPLLPHRYTTLGPGMSAGDVNGDGLQDLFVGNARESKGSTLFLLQKDGKYSVAGSQPWQSLDADVMGSLLFDCDGDRDLDLYVAVGGSEFEWPSNKYQHQLYLNDGKGNFSVAKDRLPNVVSSSSSVSSSDYDSDGDLDLFVAGRLMPGNWPTLEVRSYLLQNNGGKFRDVTAALAPDLENAGMICSAIFSDYNGDGKPDLLLAGEWMPLIFMENTGGKFVNKTGEVGDASLSGWMNSITPTDIDNDGDLDYIVGNKGNNSFIQAKVGSPTKVFWADFDGNGRQDIAMSYHYGGSDYPLFTMDEMGKAYPFFINKKFTTYNDFAGKTMEEIFGAEVLKQNSLTANYFSNFVAINNGGKFSFVELPMWAQAGPMFGTTVLDIDGNGFDDILCTGNNYNTRVPHGRDDAQPSFVLFNNGGSFTYQSGSRNGLYNQDDGKSLILCPGANGQVRAIMANNNGKLRGYTLLNGKNQPQNISFVTAPPMASYAKVTVNGSLKMVGLNGGTGYLTGNVPGVWKTKGVDKIEFFDVTGRRL
ncbi:MAG: hypothetical protein RLZZ110_1022 [Bacteroidota bacterium]